MVRQLAGPAVLLVIAACSGTPRPGSPEFARDLEAHSFAIAAHLSETEEAQLGAARGTREDIRVFAQNLIADHARSLAAHNEMSDVYNTNWGLNLGYASNLEIGRGENGATTRALPAPPPPADLVYSVNRSALDAFPASASVMRTHEDGMAALKSAEGAAFDRMFLKRQIEMHKFLIARIDQILPSVTGDALRDQLESDRGVMQAHLRMAVSAQQQ